MGMAKDNNPNKNAGYTNCIDCFKYTGISLMADVKMMCRCDVV